MGYLPNTYGISGDQLCSIVERVERLREEIAALNADVSEVYKEARGNGFDVPTIKALISERAKEEKDPQKFSEQNMLLELYRSHMGSGTPRTNGNIDNLANVRHARARAQGAPQDLTLSQVKESLHNGVLPNQDFHFEGAVVYFALWRDVGRLKVGVSNNVVRRIADIEGAIGAALEVVGTLSGNRAHEIACHKRLGDFAIGNEWFHATSECMEVVEDLLREATVAPQAGAPDAPATPHSNPASSPPVTGDTVSPSIPTVSPNPIEPLEPPVSEGSAGGAETDSHSVTVPPEPNHGEFQIVDGVRVEQPPEIPAALVRSRSR